MTEFWVLDETYKLKGVIDNYKSVIWTERFSTNGDFEIYCQKNEYNYNILRLNSDTCTPVFIMRSDDTSKMAILTDVKYTFSPEDGEMIVASGYTDDYLLHYRVIFEQANYFGNAEYAIRHMVQNAFIHNEFGYYTRNTNDLILGSMIGLADTYRIDAQYQGVYLDEAISKTCQDLGIGYGISFNAATNKFVFNIAVGQSRPSVIFSVNLDNVLSSEYTNKVKPNTIYAIGVGDGVNRYVGEYDTESTERTGLFRQELYVDADKVSNNGDSFNILSYVNLLKGAAKQEYADKYSNNETIESSVVTNSYRLGIDYNLGDIVTTILTVGVNGGTLKKLQQRVVEIVECWDDNGYTCEPSFETV